MQVRGVECQYRVTVFDYAGTLLRAWYPYPEATYEVTEDDVYYINHPSLWTDGVPVNTAYAAMKLPGVIGWSADGQSLLIISRQYAALPGDTWTDAFGRPFPAVHPQLRLYNLNGQLLASYDLPESFNGTTASYSTMLVDRGAGWAYAAAKMTSTSSSRSVVMGMQIVEGAVELTELWEYTDPYAESSYYLSALKSDAAGILRFGMWYGSIGYYLHGYEMDADGVTVINDYLATPGTPYGDRHYWTGSIPYLGLSEIVRSIQLGPPPGPSYQYAFDGQPGQFPNELLLQSGLVFSYSGTYGMDPINYIGVTDDHFVIPATVPEGGWPITGAIMPTLLFALYNRADQSPVRTFGDPYDMAQFDDLAHPYPHGTISGHGTMAQLQAAQRYAILDLDGGTSQLPPYGGPSAYAQIGSVIDRRNGWHLLVFTDAAGAVRYQQKPVGAGQPWATSVLVADAGENPALVIEWDGTLSCYYELSGSILRKLSRDYGRTWSNG